MLMTCPYCKHEFERRQVNRLVKEVDGQLVKIGDRQRKQQLVLAIARGALNLDQARHIAKRSGWPEQEGDEVWQVYLKNKA
jgi:hypothetical protein